MPNATASYPSEPGSKPRLTAPGHITVPTRLSTLVGPSISPAETLVNSPFACTDSLGHGVHSPISPSATVVNTPFASQSPSMESLHSSVQERLKFRLFCGLFAYFTCGWADGGTGTVMPYVKKEYNLTDMTSSVTFAAGVVGFTLGILLIEVTSRFTGRFSLASATPSFPALQFTCLYQRKAGIGYSRSQSIWITLTFFAFLHGCFFLISGLNGGFYTLLIAYVISSFSRANMTAAINGYVSSTPVKAFGYMLSAWSLGAVVSPLIFQTIVAQGIHWPKFYLGSLAVSSINALLLFTAFRPTVSEFAADKATHQNAIDSVKKGMDPEKNLKSQIPMLSKSPSPSNGTSVDTPLPENQFLKAVRLSRQWMCSLFMFLYCGSETTTQGFIVVYLLAARNADSKVVGYTTSGFWAGSLITRALWGRVTNLLTFTQRKHAMHICFAIAVAMQILICFVDSFTINAVAASCIGTVYGPFYPALLEMSNDLIPEDMHMITMAIMTAFATFGSSLMPFVAGIISTFVGASAVSYLMLTQTAVLLLAWFIFPSRTSRAKDALV